MEKGSCKCRELECAEVIISVCRIHSSGERIQGLVSKKSSIYGRHNNQLERIPVSLKNLRVRSRTLVRVILVAPLSLLHGSSSVMNWLPDYKGTMLRPC